MMRLASMGFAQTSMLFTRMEPESGRSKPVIIDSVVVLPAPLGPTIPKKDPARTSRSMPDTATVWPKLFIRPDTAITTGAGGPAREVRSAAFAIGTRWAAGTRRDRRVRPDEEL